jgi:hypothetical protein
VKKYGLTANGQAKYAPRGGLTRDQLEPLVEAGLPIRQIAARVDRSPSTVRHWIGKYGLAKSRAAKREEIEEALRNGSRTIERVCKRHGRTEFALVGSARRPRCKVCRGEAVARRRRKVKELLVAEAGGRCMICGFDRSVNALEFHHREPRQKSFGIAYGGLTRSIDQVRREAAKCVLLCANCHAQVEGGSLACPR